LVRPARQINARQAHPNNHPPLSLDEAIETTKIHSIAGLLDSENLRFDPTIPRPASHYQRHWAARCGTFPNPGEVSIAHNGVLFLDELLSSNDPHWK